jgi:uncharacterized protein YjbK
MFKLKMGYKQYEINFEVATPSQIKMQFQNFAQVFRFLTIQVHG